MRIPYLSAGMDKRIRWMEDNTLRRHCFDEFFAMIEQSDILNPSLLLRLHDLLNSKIEGRPAEKMS